MVEVILFDLDGTLIDTLPLYVKAYNQALIEQGFIFNERKIVSTCFGKTEDIICQSLGLPGKADQFRQTYFDGVKTYFKDAKLIDGVTEVLNICNEKKIRLAIVSFSYSWYIDEIIKKLGLDRYFEIIIGFDDVHNAKPDPEAALLACKKLNANPQDAVVIGDSKADILMGKAAGCKTILFNQKEYDLFYDLETLKQSNPDKIIVNYDGLKEMLMNNNLF